jgi:23S rRNA pseudouridine2605 synthase
MTDNKQRIAKFMASAGLCSRRDAEAWIEDGRVAVNGVVLTTPATLVGDADDIHVDGKRISNTAPKPRVWLYHKPAGLMTTHHDPQGRHTVFEHLPHDIPRVISVGRLDLDSEGLLILTTSGALARAMELPSNAQSRVYKVRIRGLPMQTHLDQLRRGVTIDGVHYKSITVTVDNQKESGRNQWLTVALSEGKNREIRRIFEHFDLPVSRLIRISYGPYALGDLRPEAVHEIPPAEVAKLMKKLGL